MNKLSHSLSLLAFLCVALSANPALAQNWDPVRSHHEQEFNDAVHEGDEDPSPLNVELLGNIHYDVTANDIWGYTAPDGREYALVGLLNGVSIVDITDPRNPVESAFIPGTSSRWRDLKTLDNYLYVVADQGADGLTIIDLTNLPSGAELVGNDTNHFEKAHNLGIDTERALAYVVGSNLAGGGVLILDLSNPTTPEQVGIWNTTYVHDIYPDGDVVYTFDAGAGVAVLDVSDPTQPTTLSAFSYPNQQYTHSGWATPDREFLLVNDEFDERLTGINTRLIILKRVGDTFDYEPFSEYIGPNKSVDHNVFYKGGLAYLSNYTYGFTLINLADPSDPWMQAHYDTFLENDDPDFAGAWGIYPFFLSGHVIVSDINSGLFIFEILPEDLDGDGMMSIDETRDLDSSTEGIQNPFDPRDPDSTGDNLQDGPDGVLDGRNDWDGDGLSNEIEFALGLNPIDPVDVVETPTASVTSVGLTTLLLLNAARRRWRRWNG